MDLVSFRSIACLWSGGVDETDVRHMLARQASLDGGVLKNQED